MTTLSIRPRLFSLVTLLLSAALLLSSCLGSTRPTIHPPGGSGDAGPGPNPRLFEGHVVGTVAYSFIPEPSDLGSATYLGRSATVAAPQSIDLFASQDINEVVVTLRTFTPSASFEELLAAWGGHIDRSLYGGRGVVVQVPEGVDALSLIEALLELPDVVDAEPNQHFTALSQEPIIPNDPLFFRQWHLTDIRMPEAWRLERGRPGIIVAVLDSGYSSHPDLPQPGDSRFAGGQSFVGGDIWDDPAGGGWSHGVQVAGIIGAHSNNQQLGAGIGWHIQLLPVRVLDRNGNGRLSDIANGIRWATDQGAHVINLSLGDALGNSDPPTGVLADAIEYAVNRGVTLVAASGNHGGIVTSPASHPLVIAVGATDASGLPADWSGRGNAAAGLELDLVAPGSAIATTLSRIDRHTFSGESLTAPYVSGTSYATPQVSAVVALLYSQGVLSRSMGPAATDLAREILRSTAIPLDSTRRYDDAWGYGRLDAFATLSWVDLPSLDQVTVFAGLFDDGEILAVHPPVQATSDGSFLLKNVPIGQYTLFAWIDRDGSGQVTPGDYFATLTDVVVEPDAYTSDVHLTLSITDDAYPLNFPPENF